MGVAMKKFIKVTIIVLVLATLFAGCGKSYDVSTKIGSFTLSPEIATSFADYTPGEGKEFLLFTLNSADYSMTIDTMSEYFRPNEYSPGPQAIVGGTTYDLKYIAYGKGTPPPCILIYEVPQGTKDLEAVTLELH